MKPINLKPDTYLKILNEYSKILSEARVTPINKNLIQRYFHTLNNFAKVRTYLRNQGVI